MMATGGVVAGRVLRRRHAWEQGHNSVAICADFDDVNAAAVRAGMRLDDLLPELAEHGATHLSLPELTLNRLRASGQLAPLAPAAPRPTPPPVGHWNYLHGPAELVAWLAAELAARLPYTQAQVDGNTCLAFAGDLHALGEIGLGFEAGLAQRINQAGLACVPRPVSYAWPEDRLIELTLAQAACFGNLIAFEGDLILGHEMHLDATLTAMAREGLALVYFAESRHQKGDWFVAKRRAPRVVLGHRLTPRAMIPLDFHAAAHIWAYLARERGIRFCYVDFFKVLHATEPLEGLHYIEHIREALGQAGFVVASEVRPATPVPAPSRGEMAMVGLASGGIAASAVSATLSLPEAAALPLTIAAGAVAALPYLERARGDLEAQYPPSYAPKLLALTSASLAPVAGMQLARRHGVEGWLIGVAAQAAAGASMAAVTSGQDYQLRIEEFRGFDLDWLLPLASAALTAENPALRRAGLIVLAGLWAYARQHDLDPLARFDPAHAEGHTHHLSAAARLIGDTQIALGPQPARKWFGLGPLGAALGVVWARRRHPDLAIVAALLAALGGALGLVGFRRPERALTMTLREALPSFGGGVMLGLLALGLGRIAVDSE